MVYETWRITYQNSEQAARAAFNESIRLRTALARIANMTDREGNEIEMHRDELRGVAHSAITPNVEVRGCATGERKIDV